MQMREQPQSLAAPSRLEIKRDIHPQCISRILAPVRRSCRFTNVCLYNKSCEEPYCLLYKVERFKIRYEPQLKLAKKVLSVAWYIFSFPVVIHSFYFTTDFFSFTGDFSLEKFQYVLRYMCSLQAINSAIFKKVK